MTMIMRRILYVKDIANYIQEMDHLLSKLCDLKELDQKARHIDIEQLLGKDVIALGRILPDSGLEAVRAAMVSQADKEQKEDSRKIGVNDWKTISVFRKAGYHVSGNRNCRLYFELCRAV